MTIVHKILEFFRKKNYYLSFSSIKSSRLARSKVLTITTFLVFFSSLFFISINLINKKNEERANNFNEITKNDEISNLTKFLLSKINSPYKEISYVIKNNDTVEKILKKFGVRNEDIKAIIVELQKQKLSNIYTGRKISLIIKKLENKTNTLVNFTYPVNNTTSVEIRKSQNNFIVKENILQLYKKKL